MENEVEVEVEDDVNDEVDAIIETNLHVLDSVESETQGFVASTTRNIAHDITMAEVETIISLETDFDSAKIYTDNWLILADPKDNSFLESNGYRIISSQYLPSLQQNLVRVEAPASFKFSALGKEVRQRLNNKERALDFNHIYDLSSAVSPSKTYPNQFIPNDLMKLPSPTNTQNIGVIDTHVEVSHPSFKTSTIISNEFSEENAIKTSSHANSIISILIGNEDSYHGLLENIDIYSASVFFIDDEHHEITTTASLVKALDWLVSQKVKVINMSLVGPHNKVLSRAIESYCEQGIIIVAAVGNNGPHSTPQYPAAYDCVVGVTAINAHNKIYRRSARGSHVDVASYGVNILAADNQRGYQGVTGTSFATPFVSAYIASQLVEQPLNSKNHQAWLETIFKDIEDLGAPGKDDIYGYGALTTPNY